MSIENQPDTVEGVSKIEAIKVPNHAVIYRNNEFWSQMSESVLHFASLYQEPGKGRTSPVRKGATIKVLQVFTENTTEAEIAQWLDENQAQLADIKEIICDQTVSSIIGNKLPKSVLDEARNEIAEKMIGEKNVTEVYREILKGIFDAYQTKCVQLVKSSLGDYDPLKINESDSRTEEANEKYVAAFTALIPEGIKVEVINDPMALELPNDQTVVIVHHHAIGRHKNSSELNKCPRVVNLYLSGLMKKASTAFDIANILPEGFVEKTRQALEERYQRAIK